MKVRTTLHLPKYLPKLNVVNRIREKRGKPPLKIRTKRLRDSPEHTLMKSEQSEGCVRVFTAEQKEKLGCWCLKCMHFDPNTRKAEIFCKCTHLDNQCAAENIDEVHDTRAARFD
jgi:hypothetical protein